MNVGVWLLQYVQVVNWYDAEKRLCASFAGLDQVQPRPSSNAGGDSLSYLNGKVIGETAGEDTTDDVAEDDEENDRRAVCLYGRGKSCSSLKSYPNNGFRLSASSRRQAWLQYKAFPEKIFWSQTGHQFRSLMMK